MGVEKTCKIYKNLKFRTYNPRKYHSVKRLSNLKLPVIKPEAAVYKMLKKLLFIILLALHWVIFFVPN